MKYKLTIFGLMTMAFFLGIQYPSIAGRISSGIYGKLSETGEGVDEGVEVKGNRYRFFDPDEEYNSSWIPTSQLRFIKNGIFQIPATGNSYYCSANLLPKNTNTPQKCTRNGWRKIF